MVKLDCAGAPVSSVLDEVDEEALHVVSVSGGKDSTATSLYLTELGVPHRRVFSDTGWELPETYDYIRTVLEPVLGPIDWVRGKKQMEELVLSKRMFPSRRRRYCTEQLKFLPIKRYLHDLANDIGGPVVNVIGVRADESRARSKLPEREYDDGMELDVWRPIIDWGLEDVVAIHKRHSVRPNPLYLKGFTRVGCAPCIMANKGEVRLLAEEYPEQINRVRALEQALSHKKGKHGTSPKFFQSPLGIRRPGEDKASYPPASIDEVVEWSRTTRGGRQYDLLPSRSPRDGCMRWGLCDTGEQ